MFCWLGCADGTSIDSNRIEALGTQRIPIYENNPGPNNEPVPQKDAAGDPMSKMFVVAVMTSGAIYPMKEVGGMHEAQLIIQGILGKLRDELKKSQSSIIT